MADGTTGSPQGGHVLRKVGDFEIISKLGQGAMGAVFKARQGMLDRIVALKVLPPAIAQDQGFIERFVREARASAKLSHPNIVAGIDVGQDETTKLWYFAMEFVDGSTVKQMQDRQARIPEDQALRIARDMAQALECAWQAGMVHRDVKPDNILVMSDGRAKLADLGLARQIDEDSSLTQSGQAVGTPYYMAPEQARGENETLDTRADLYALGATLFHMVVGVPPFTGETAAVIMAKHLTEAPPVAQQVHPGVSVGCSRLIHRLMQKDPSRRYQTPGEVAEQIEALLKVPLEVRGGTTGLRGLVREPKRVTGVGRNRSGRDGAPASAARSQLPMIMGGVVGLVVVGLIGFFAFSGTENRNPVSAKKQPDTSDRSDTSDTSDQSGTSDASDKSVRPPTALMPTQPVPVPDPVASVAPPDAGGGPIPPDRLLSMLNTAVSGHPWRVEGEAISGRVGSIDADSGKILMKESFSARSFEFGFKMIAKQYQAILVMIDGQRYYYSRGHWSNTGGFVLTPNGLDRRRGRETVAAPEAWAALDVAMADDLLVFKYNGEVVARCPIKTNPGRAHEIRVGFGSHEVPIRIKDFTVRKP